MLLDDLNEAQRAAVECIDKPSLVIAGAGSGKTRVLTYKIAYLLEQGMKPWNILALTFTNKAAREMQQRIEKQVGSELSHGLWMGTFHSIFSRILRIESQFIGFSNNFTIYDDSDQKSLVRTIIREMQLDEKQYKPGAVINRISEAKNRLLFPNQYMNDAHARQRDEASRMPAIAQIYLRYMQRCRLSDAMDFDDLLLYTFYLFDRNPEICLKYQERFHFVLVDEYQDTNYAQHRIVWQLTEKRQRVCVVGDDAQSIYSFRGANIDNILHFQELYKDAQLFKLERNYRSTQTIVKAANSLIACNRGQIKKDVYSEKVEGQPIRLYNVASDYEEAIIVASRIANLHHRDHISYNDIAILYRTNSQSRSLEEALRKQSLPYHIYGGVSFYQRKEIKDVIAYLRLSVNPRDEEALKRIINYPTRGIGNTTLERILITASNANVSPWQVLIAPTQFNLNVNNGTIAKLTKFAELITSFNALTESTDALTLAKKIIFDSGLAADINKGTEPDDISRQENLQELVDGIASFVQEQTESGESALLTDYLQQVSLLSDLDDEDSRDLSENGETTIKPDEKITLMTVHSAKGLEFRVVFVVGLEEELFPNQMALQEGTKGLEEERRLMYVAMTRAEEQLYLTCAKSRFRFGKTEMSNPSRFLHEIDKRFITSRPSSFSSSNTSAKYSSPNSSSGFYTSNNSSKSSSVNTFRTSRVSSTNPFGSSGLFNNNHSTINPSTQRPNQQRIPSTGNFVKISGRPYDAGIKQTNAQSTSSTSSTDTLKAGNVVEHSRFGRGIVEAVEGSGIDAKATVRFDNVGTKQLLLRFAKITVIS